ncbi:MAG: hypothetical protein K2W82_17255 [Candidatus Obscuribacterales bacterium]|jgi:preprotein translocase subunit Sss1|nr:hypothetical protein [Candidatus Obscuribacterales bacterium]
MTNVIVFVSLSLVFLFSYFCGVRLSNVLRHSPERDDIHGLATVVSLIIGIVGFGIAGYHDSGIKMIGMFAMGFIGFVLSLALSMISVGFGYLSGSLWINVFGRH